MTNRRTLNDVIIPNTNPSAGQGFNPNAFQNQTNTFTINNQANETRTPAEIRAQNDRIRAMIAAMRERKPVIQETQYPQDGIPQQFNKRIQFNEQKIRDLKHQIGDQEEVIKAYIQKFNQFEQNLGKLMRLDKDIHHKLVNPEHSTTLEKNVQNVIVALNSGAPYNRVVQMLNNIKV